MCIYDDGNSVFRGKNYYLHWKIWGFDMWSKVPYLESPTLICLFTMQLLWGYNDD